jgi:Fic family protein
MNGAEFKESFPGSLKPIPEGTIAFIPNPLPPKFELDLDTIRLLSEATFALGELKGIGDMLPNAYLLIGPFLNREAVLSSRIEGTVATMEQLALLEAVPTTETEPAQIDALEVRNYVRAASRGLEMLNQLPICLRLIKELHGILLSGVRGKDKRPGDFRDRQNFIATKRTDPIQTARYVPPPVLEMQAALQDLENFFYSKSKYPPLIELALIHYQFEAIHPFMDGNGRIGRLLTTLFLAERKILERPLLYLSGYFDQNRADYQDHLLNVSRSGAWTPWVRFFLEGVSSQSKDAVSRAKKLISHWKETRNKFTGVRSSASVLKLVDELFKMPAITVPQAGRVLGMRYPSAQRTVSKLVDGGFLTERPGKKRNRVYVAPSIIAIVEAEAPE